MLSWTREQSKIIYKNAGSTCVIAAPGSGKTSVLTEHIVHVLDERKIRPQSLMAVTFTRQAALHMRHKLGHHSNLSHREWESLRIGTFHSQMFHALLERHPDIPVLLNAREQHVMMRQAVERALGDRRHISHQAVTQKLTSYSRDIGLGTLSSAAKSLARVYTAYQTIKRRAHRWDYEDILVETDRLIQQSQPIPYFQQLEYLLVDEFQDTNQLQWNVVLGLHQRYGCPVFVVGDDDQSIYAFRGASPLFLQGATKRLRDSQLCLLTYNFRSVRRVVHHSEQLIRHVTKRIDKPLRSVSTDDGLICMYTLDNEKSESTAVLLLLQTILEANDKLTIGVLARTRKQLYGAWVKFQSETSFVTRDEDRVQFRTFHDSKGKEWDAVVLLDLVTQYSECNSIVEDAQLDERRRLYYVAMTRAKSILIGFVPKSLNLHRVIPSAYLDESGLAVSDWSVQSLQSVRSFAQDMK